jgi:hypothetical protein
MGSIVKKKTASYIVWTGVAVIAISHIYILSMSTGMTMLAMQNHAWINLIALGVLVFGGSQMGGK